MGKDGSLISVPRGLFTAGLLLQASNRAEDQRLCPKSLPLSLAVCHEGPRSCAVKHFFISPRPAFSQPLAGPSCCDGLRLRYPHSCLSPLQPMPPQELPSAPRAGCGAPLRLHCPTEEKAKAEAEQGTSYLHPNPCGVPRTKGHPPGCHHPPSQHGHSPVPPFFCRSRLVASFLCWLPGKGPYSRRGSDPIPGGTGLPGGPQPGLGMGTGTGQCTRSASFPAVTQPTLREGGGWG